MSRGPILTLVAVLALGAALFGLNLAAGGGPTPTPESAAASAPTAPEVDAPLKADAPLEADAPEADAPDSGTAPDLPATGRFDGTTAGGVPVTIWVDGERARASVCDDETIEYWLTGTARDGRVEATGKNGARLDGRYADGRVTGTTQVPGHPAWTYTAGPR